jgi:hypothetical protein
MRCHHALHSLVHLSWILLLAAASAPACFAETPFAVEAIDTEGLIGQYSSVALDPHGNPCVSYHDATNGNLEYAEKAGADWVIETVASTGVVGTWTSLVLDSTGDPWISYRDETNGDLKLAHRSSGAWTIETVYSTGDVGTHSSLALTADGSPRIAFLDVTNWDLKYATKSGAVWTILTVDTDCNGYISIALDQLDSPYIAYGSGAGLKVAWRPGGTWVMDTIDATAISGAYCSIALDPTQIPAVSYYDYVNGNLKYATKTGSVWTIETVDSTGDVGFCSSLAFDLSGFPHISYYGTYALKYASHPATVWTNETVMLLDPLGRYGTSLALDRYGSPCITCYDGANGDLWLADGAVRLVYPCGGERWACGSEQMVKWSGAGSVSVDISPDGGMTWSTLVTSCLDHEVPVVVPDMTTDLARVRVVRTTPYAAAECGASLQIAPGLVSPWWNEAVDGTTHYVIGLALDAQDAPCLAYHDGSSYDLKFAYRSGATWTTETVDAAGLTGYDVSLALDADGNPRISYVDDTNDDLKFAARDEGAWTIATVDAGLISGLNRTSLALDGSGNPWISYYNDTTDDLMLAHESGGSWTIETVDATGSVGTYSSLAFDPDGNLGIGYYDVTNSALKYAHRSAGTWTVETVDSEGSVGTHGSLAFDLAGNPCLCYQCATSRDLMFAVKQDGAWAIETVDAPGNVGVHTDLVIDGAGNPWITYYDDTNLRVKLAHRTGGAWYFESLEGAGVPATGASLALDAQGNPHIGYRDASYVLHYGSAAVELTEPIADTVWPVGALRKVRWHGHGQVDVYLSVDGGASWDLLETGLSEGSFECAVPHTPTRFARLKLVREVPYSETVTEGLFTIEASVELLDFTARSEPDGGIELSWRTNPGPEDLAGYRLERSETTGQWRTLLEGSRATSYRDIAGGPGVRYRLTAVNGLGKALELGETETIPLRPLAAWPTPYAGGPLNISFATASAPGGGPGDTEVAIFDTSGRLVRTLVHERFPAGYHTATWDGRNDAGAPVSGGVYFLRARAEGRSLALKLMVLAR